MEIETVDLMDIVVFEKVFGSNDEAKVELEEM